MPPHIDVVDADLSVAAFPSREGTVGHVIAPLR
jgi:hypothetical protein